MVDDDDDVESPSPKPRTDSSSALSMKNKRWHRFCIVKRDDSFSLIFFLREMVYMELELGQLEAPGAHKLIGHALGVGAPPELVAPG